jgi:hypothetical protein
MSAKKNYIPVSIFKSLALIEDCIQAGQVPLILGPPGTGKTAVIQVVADNFNLLLIGHNLTTSEPTDMSGFPDMDCFINNIKRSTFAPPAMFPLEGDPLPMNASGIAKTKSNGQLRSGEKGYQELTDDDYYDGWLFNLDEMTSATIETQTASHKFIHERKIGQYKLHPNCAIVATGNEVDDGNSVNEMGTAMQSRLCTLHVYVDDKEFLDYANKAHFDYRLRGYLSWKPDMIHSFSPDHDNDTFACPRTNEAMSKLLKVWGDGAVDATKLPLMIGTTGPAHANGLYGYCRIFANLPSIEDLRNNPLMVTVPTQPDVRAALSTLIGEAITPKNCPDMMVLIQKLPLEFQVLAMTSAAESCPEIQAEPDVCNWFVLNAEELY